MSENLADYHPEYTADKLPGGLTEIQLVWPQLQPWLEERGYVLRPRYRRGWKPSWLESGKDMFECEGYEMMIVIMDAVRVKDGEVVALKQVERSLCPYEVGIGTMFSTEPLRLDPKNHCVPIYDVLQSPLDEDTVILVMPFLWPYKDVRFATVGEAVECIRQLFEGLVFMHRHYVAHRDIHEFNVMMDPLPLFWEMPHPSFPRKSYDFRRRVKRYTRTSRPTKYYFVDFGHSRHFGAATTVPEFHNSAAPQNPFWTDVYYLGNLLREDFLQRFLDFDFLAPLVNDMVQDDPPKRPSAAEAFARFAHIRLSLSSLRLRSRVIHRKDSSFFGFFRMCRHVVRTVGYVITGTPTLQHESSGSSSCGCSSNVESPAC
ncbi:hypothetical protein OH77DRAFT_1504459 [Trametes cingulata]|nr:hypothetical protein OH77DRAFT_1504459 [Trametes cingulata]